LDDVNLVAAARILRITPTRAAVGIVEAQGPGPAAPSAEGPVVFKLGTSGASGGEEGDESESKLGDHDRMM